MKLTAAANVALALALCSGCMVHRVPDRSAPPVIVPPAFSQSGDAPAHDRWWRDFDDPVLTALIHQALADNLDLRSAWARLGQSAALARQAGAPLWPELDATGAASRSRTEAAGPVVRTTQYSLSLAASYEIDLWGRVRSQERAAALDFAASREDLEAAAITVAATVGDVWYSLVEQREQRLLLDQQIETSETLLELAELRFSQGLASALDVYQQRQQLATTRGQVPGVESRRRVLEHQLAVLLGRTPMADMVPGPLALPDLPRLPEAGLPADMLARRPDVRAAQARLAAADHRVAAAVAARLPSLSLTGSAGYAAGRSQDLWNSQAWSMAASALAPVFDAGRRAAEVSRTKARVDEALALYTQTILTAFREVEDALVQERKQWEYVASVREQLELATSTLREARERYSNGLSDYLPVLAAVQSHHQVARELISARRQLISFRIQLYRSLGGTWPRGLAPEAGAAGEKK